MPFHQETFLSSKIALKPKVFLRKTRSKFRRIKRALKNAKFSVENMKKYCFQITFYQFIIHENCIFSELKCEVMRKKHTFSRKKSYDIISYESFFSIFVRKINWKNISYEILRKIEALLITMVPTHFLTVRKYSRCASKAKAQWLIAVPVEVFQNLCQKPHFFG